MEAFMGMRVCYCEDEIAQARLLKSQIEAWGIGHNIKINMDIFESAEEFLFKAQPLDFDLIFELAHVFSSYGQYL